MLKKKKKAVSTQEGPQSTPPFKKSYGTKVAEEVNNSGKSVGKIENSKTMWTMNRNKMNKTGVWAASLCLSQIHEWEP